MVFKTCCLDGDRIEPKYNSSPVQVHIKTHQRSPKEVHVKRSSRVFLLQGVWLTGAYGLRQWEKSTAVSRKQTGHNPSLSMRRLGVGDQCGKTGRVSFLSASGLPALSTRAHGDIGITHIKSKIFKENYGWYETDHMDFVEHTSDAFNIKEHIKI